jgi:hypothetical protein
MNFLVGTETWSGKGCQRDLPGVDGNRLLDFQALSDEFEEVRGAGVSATWTRPLFRVFTVVERNNPLRSGRGRAVSLHVVMSEFRV